MYGSSSAGAALCCRVADAAVGGGAGGSVGGKKSPATDELPSERPGKSEEKPRTGQLVMLQLLASCFWG